MPEPCQFCTTPTCILISKEHPRFSCMFCDRTYRGILVNHALQIFRINCQFCLVEFQFEHGKPFLIDYRLHDPILKRLRVWIQVNQALTPNSTQVYLQYKQKQIKNPPKDYCFHFNTARTPKPKDALAHAKRLMNLVIFS